MTAAVGPKTYKALFSDPSLNPLDAGDGAKAGYQEVYQRWRTVHNAPEAADVLQDALMDLAEPIGAIGTFVRDGHSASGGLKITHGLMKYTGRPRWADPLRGHALAYLGDVIVIDIQTMAISWNELTKLGCQALPNEPWSY